MEETQQDPIRQIAESIVNQRKGINDTVREKVINELIESMNRMINSELLSRLDNQQLKEFNEYLDKNPSDNDVLEFFDNKGIDVNAAVSVALRRFKDAYTG